MGLDIIRKKYGRWEICLLVGSKVMQNTGVLFAAVKLSALRVPPYSGLYAVSKTMGSSICSIIINN